MCESESAVSDISVKDTNKDDDDFWMFSEIKNTIFSNEKEPEHSFSVTSFPDFDTYQFTDTFQPNLNKRINSEKKKSTFGIYLNNAEDTVEKIILGQSYILESYKSLSDKRKLLDVAIEVGDGDSILTILLFLQKSLKESLFIQEMRRQPLALSHYLKYLRDRGLMNEYIDVQIKLGWSREAALGKLRCLFESTFHSKLKELKNIYNLYFCNNPDLKFEAKILEECIHLYELQPILEGIRSENNDTVNFKTLMNIPLLSLIYYCCVNFWKETPGHFGSPQLLKKQFCLTDKEFNWQATMAFLYLRQWQQIQDLLFTKNFLGSLKMRNNFSIQKLLQVFENNDAPDNLKKMLLTACDMSIAEKIKIGSKFKCHSFVIENLALQRDKAQLLEYQKQFSEGSVDWLHAESLLEQQGIRWKT